MHQCWVRQGLGAEQAITHYPNQRRQDDTVLDYLPQNWSIDRSLKYIKRLRTYIRNIHGNMLFKTYGILYSPINCFHIQYNIFLCKLKSKRNLVKNSSFVYLNVLKKYDNLLAFPVISWRWYDTSCWNPSSRNFNIYSKNNDCWW